MSFLKNLLVSAAMDFSSINLRRWLLTIFAFACLGLNLIVYVLFSKNQELVASKQWVQHTYEVIVKADQMFFSIQDIEIATRGFLLTKNDRFLEPMAPAETRIDESYKTIKDLTKDNPERQAQIDDLWGTYQKMHDLALKQIELKRNQDRFDMDWMLEKKRLMDRVRFLAEEIQAGEEDLLVTRTQEQNKRQQAYVNTVFASAGFAVVGLILASLAITFLTLRRQAAEDSLKRANKEMEGFTYIASHDLRSPLVNLKGFASEMRYGIDELQPILQNLMQHATEDEKATINRILEEDIADALKYIHSSVEKMDKLTNAILELSRIGRRTLQVETINPTKIVQHCLDTLHHQIVTKNVDVKIHSMPEVVADPLIIEQVFGNVLDNAIKYLSPDRPGRIDIGGGRNYRETTFWVKDNGRGIDPADMQKIFEIYRRGGNNAGVEGEGMGMAYVRATLRRMDGTIWCDSEPGQGTTFFFTISNTLKKDNLK